MSSQQHKIVKKQSMEERCIKFNRVPTWLSQNWHTNLSNWNLHKKVKQKFWRYCLQKSMSGEYQNLYSPSWNLSFIFLFWLEISWRRAYSVINYPITHSPRLSPLEQKGSKSWSPALTSLHHIHACPPKQ